MPNVACGMWHCYIQLPVNATQTQWGCRRLDASQSTPYRSTTLLSKCTTRAPTRAVPTFPQHRATCAAAQGVPCHTSAGHSALPSSNARGSTGCAGSTPYGIGGANRPPRRRGIIMSVILAPELGPLPSQADLATNEVQRQLLKHSCTRAHKKCDV